MHKRPTLGTCIQILTDALQAGYEHTHDGITYVWLDHHITREEMNDQGEMQYWGIDGLAMKMTKVNGSTGEESPHYMGVHHPEAQLHRMAEAASNEDLFAMAAGNALRGMNKVRA